MGDALSEPIGVSLEIQSFGKGILAMSGKVEAGNLRDIFDVEGMLFEHSDSHRVEIVLVS